MMRFKFEKVVDSNNQFCYKVSSISGVKTYENLPDKYIHGKEFCHMRGDELVLNNFDGIYDVKIRIDSVIDLRKWEAKFKPYLKRCKKSLKAVYREHKSLCSVWNGEIEIKI